MNIINNQYQYCYDSLKITTDFTPWKHQDAECSVPDIVPPSMRFMNSALPHFQASGHHFPTNIHYVRHPAEIALNA
jgi:hypothetical protein